jgi:uncharacterized protein (DUF433 family)
MVDARMDDRISANPEIFGGKPIIRGMRISVELVLRLLARGETAESLRTDYPDLEAKDIRACIAYAHAMIARQARGVAGVSGQGMTTLARRIEASPTGMRGKPVIRGTRVTVELVLLKLSEGATVHDLLDGYPRLTRQDIRTALAHAAGTGARVMTRGRVRVGPRRGA